MQILARVAQLIKVIAQRYTVAERSLGYSAVSNMRFGPTCENTRKILISHECISNSLAHSNEKLSKNISIIIGIVMMTDTSKETWNSIDLTAPCDKASVNLSLCMNRLMHVMGPTDIMMRIINRCAVFEFRNDIVLLSVPIVFTEKPEWPEIPRRWHCYRSVFIVAIS